MSVGTLPVYRGLRHSPWCCDAASSPRTSSSAPRCCFRWHCGLVRRRWMYLSRRPGRPIFPAAPSCFGLLARIRRGTAGGSKASSPGFRSTSSVWQSFVDTGSIHRWKDRPTSGGTRPRISSAAGSRGRRRAWAVAKLLRLSAVSSVPRRCHGYRTEARALVAHAREATQDQIPHWCGR